APPPTSTDPPPPPTEAATTPPETTPAPPTEPPLPPDRTAQILAALAQAHTREAVAHILDYYGFAHERFIRGNGERLYFYSTNQGSGDILVGLATCDNGEWQRRQFALFDTGAVPTDVMELILFMERN
ncbi:MAG: hypothetical protein FWC71_12070, partial [Defluviitaleaceae bacterium]|nr:hypothetical protein [Defluviitaleaceae bacterium]